MSTQSSTVPLSRQGQGGSFTLQVPEGGIQPVYHEAASKTTVLSGQTPFAQDRYPSRDSIGLPNAAIALEAQIQARESVGNRARQTVVLEQPPIIQTRIFTTPTTTTHVVTDNTTYRQPIGDREPVKPRGLACSFLTFIVAAVCVVAFSIFFMMDQRR